MGALNIVHIVKYGGLKKKCIVRLTKAELELEKKMTLPILTALLCCNASKDHKAQLTTKRGWRERTKKRDPFSFPRVNFSFKTL